MTGLRSRMCSAAIVVAIAASAGGCSVLSPDALPTAQSFRSGWDLNVQLGSVVNLPAQSRVLVNGADAGVVRSTSVRGSIATAELTIDDDVRVVTDATVEVRQDTLLGDTYISIHNPPASRSAVVADGGTVARTQAKEPVQIEDLFRDLANFVGSGSIVQLGGTISYVNSKLPADPDEIRRAQVPLLQILQVLGDDTANGNKLLTGFARVSQQLAAQKAKLSFLLSSGGNRAVEGIAGLRDLVDLFGQLSSALVPVVPLAPALRAGGDLVNSVLIPFLVPGRPNSDNGRSTAANLENLLRTKIVPFLQKSPKFNIRTIMVDSGMSNRDVSEQMVRTLRMMGLTR
ncbi:MlaD family protein [Williamsia sp.]|uniref:MlaD family protein n=1 Tax=Williamsia sp. TaxID=1872085 RepID=UPI001A28EDBD|nr:MlaD family protein [Williamsia sp.]MBJ7291066.1 MCE family protein [Williamsia sp.]